MEWQFKWVKCQLFKFSDISAKVIMVQGNNVYCYLNFILEWHVSFKKVGCCLEHLKKEWKIFELQKKVYTIIKRKNIFKPHELTCVIFRYIKLLFCGKKATSFALTFMLDGKVVIDLSTTNYPKYPHFHPWKTIFSPLKTKFEH